MRDTASFCNILSIYNNEKYIEDNINIAGSGLMKVNVSPDQLALLNQDIRFQDDTNTYEYLMVLYLDAFNQALISIEFSSLKKNQVQVKLKNIFREGIKYGAEKIILFHNHPSSNVKPSKSDLYLTNRIKRAGKLLGIILQDHIITGKSNYFSFRANGIL